LDIEIANAREEALNKLLTGAWDNFTQALGEGTVAELESKYAKLAEEIVRDILKPATIAAAPMKD